eukprot:TRINITY_DN1037_c0_g1_i1.p2 TRINITY_DN1037_c0_g1~~TRINITY_DN1037_c0_g1_i1.p2  ORF type:complete len:189 (-),score=17.61 TRINITY_DN1037_c0_g1_i1:544-1110(-)
MASISRSSVLLVALLAFAVACSAQTAKSGATPVGPPTPFDEAVKKLNDSGYTRFVSLVTAYGKIKEVKAALNQPLTLLVPNNAAIDKVKLTSYTSDQLITVVTLQVLKGVVPFEKLKALPLNTTVPTMAVSKTKKPLPLVKVAGKRPGAVVLAGSPTSKMAIVNGNFYAKPGKLVVHTTNAVVFPAVL